MPRWGPTLAAAILSMASWHWLFAINIPIGIAAVWLSMRFLPYNPVRLSDRRFDWRDGVMNALTFGLLIASVEGFSHGLDPRIVACGASAFCVVGYLFVRSQLRKPYPLLPFDLLRIPIFSLSVFTSICSFVAQMLALVALPFFLQKELGYSDVQTGLLLTAWPAVIVVVAPVAGLLVERVHACGKEVHVWTVNKKSELERMKMIGVDNIITDRPILAREVILGEENAENLLARLRALLR